MSEDKPKCAGETTRGKPCRSWPITGSKYCYHHLDQIVIDMARERAARADRDGEDATDDYDKRAYDDLLRAVTLGDYTVEIAIGGAGTKRVKIDPLVRLAYGKEWARLRGWYEGLDRDPSDDEERGTVMFAPYREDDG